MNLFIILGLNVEIQTILKIKYFYEKSTSNNPLIKHYHPVKYFLDS